MRFVLAFLLACTLSRADTLSALKSALAGLDGSGPVKASVTLESWRRASGENPPPSGKVTAIVEDGPAGLSVLWPRAVLDAVAREDSARMKDRNQRTPTRSGMDELRASTLQGYLNASRELRRVLDQAQLVEEVAETWEGQAARRLSFKLTLPLSDKDRKYIKEVDATAKIWVAADGRPLAAERTTGVKGRALLVISFEQDEREEFRFGVAGGRLLTLKHVEETHSSGAGEKGQQKTVTTLAVVNL